MRDMLWRKSPEGLLGAARPLQRQDGGHPRRRGQAQQAIADPRQARHQAWRLDLHRRAAAPAALAGAVQDGPGQAVCRVMPGWLAAA